MTLPPGEIVVIRGPQPPIDRSWQHGDACQVLRAMGFVVKETVLPADGAGPDVLPRADRPELALAWPATYNVGSDPKSTWLTDVLTTARIPFVGASSAAEQVSSKIRLADVVRRLGLASCVGQVVPRIATRGPRAIERVTDDLAGFATSFPVVVKAEYSAGSHGVEVVHRREDLPRAVTAVANRSDQDVLVEEWCRSREYTCAVLGRPGAPPVVASLEVVMSPDREIFDEHAKQSYDGVSFRDVEPARAEQLRELVGRLWRGLGEADYARIDVLEDDAGRLHVIDVNFLPALDNGAAIQSLFPMALQRTFGFRYEETLLALLAASHRRNGLPMAPRVARMAERLASL